MLRLSCNAVLLCVDVVLTVLVTWVPVLYWEGVPIALKRRCSHCQGKFFAKSPLRGDPKCGSCGYNLTGNTSGTCPECGWKLTARVKRRVRRATNRDRSGSSHRADEKR